MLAHPFAYLPALVLLLTTLGGGGGEFALRAGGDLPAADSGTAFFGAVPADHEDGPGFAIILEGATETGDTVRLALYHDAERPDAGTYTFAEHDPTAEPDPDAAFGPEEFLFAGFDDGSSGPSAGYHIGSRAGGTLEITESSDERVTGTFSLEASGGIDIMDPGRAREVAGRYEGEFVALPGQ